ncbi:Helicase SKI2W [Fasciolopsis buskii]|uniref:Helicase SKI2W n=1 Tax=Fasciolopsis buskii TaxID=27845 RepID=A0A8E0VQP9_9TREM|nr:Helicase SKI2W [Fasciolopsis buski]
MAGRAGRRGLDASGTVIILVEGVGQSVASIKTGIPSQETLTGMILGKPTQLTSQFKITYSMILHLHRTNWLSPQVNRYMCIFGKRSKNRLTLSNLFS